MTYEQPGALGQPGARARTKAPPRRRYKASGRAKRGRNGRKQRPTWRKFLGWKAFVLYFLGAILLFIIGVGIAYTNTPIPEANENLESESTIVYWNDGKTELGRFEALKRIPVGYEDMPQSLRDAVVAAEDRSFYSNSGFDPVGIARAGLGFITSGGEIQGGGSTISQQYVKNLYYTQEQTLSRKVNELFVSIKVNQEMTKNDILTDYLNLVWFGGEVHGVEVASQRFFGKSVSEINLAQSVSLAVLIKNPDIYDPRFEENVARFNERFDYVLEGMVEIGAIDQATANKTKPPKFKKYTESNQYKGTNGYLLQEVKRELTTCNGVSAGAVIDEETGEVCDPQFTAEDLNTGGYRITTTFDKAKQSAAVKAVKEERPKEDAKFVRVALSAVVPGDGAVVAMYGGRDAIKKGINDATQAEKQIGSTFKPFTLVAALENGISLDDTFAGNSPYEDPRLGDEAVTNEGFTDYGESVDLLTATEKSINTAFIDLVFHLGGDTGNKGTEIIADAAERAGIPSNPTGSRPLVGFGERLTLGTASIASTDLADAYATLAAGGRQADWYVVASVTDRGGNVLYEGKNKVETVIDPAVANEVSYALQQVVESGTGERAQEIGRPSAGKTGTHENETAWYAGYTPQLAATVGIFREDPAGKVKNDEDGGSALSLVGVEGLDHMAGGSFPLSIWNAFMEAALEGEEVIDFPERPEVDEPRNTPTPTQEPTPSDTPTDEPTEDVDETRVPNVVGRSADAAISMLIDRGLQPGSISYEETDDSSQWDKVKRSQPKEGTEVDVGTQVDLVVWVASTKEVPNVVDEYWETAKSTLEQAGFVVDPEPAEECNDELEGFVADQNPTGSARVGSTVTIEVYESCWAGGNEGGDNGNEGNGPGGQDDDDGGSTSPSPDSTLTTDPMLSRRD